MQYIKGSKPCDLHMMLFYLLMNNRLSDAWNISEELFRVSAVGGVCSVELSSTISFYIVT